MSLKHREKLAEIKTFEALIDYLRVELDWPVGRTDFDDADDLLYDYTPDELGIDAESAAKIQRIQRLRPLAVTQPWGIFFVEFEPKRLPVVALRRILSRVALKKRASANSAERTAWAADDLLFVANYGGDGERCISLAHFSAPADKNDLPTLKVLGWDNLDAPLHLDDVADKLSRLAWPEDEQDLEEWRSTWSSAFTLRHREVVNTSRELSVRLAELARTLRDRIRTALKIETDNGPLTKLMKAFQESLVHDLDPDGFADMYAQTIAYGLLTARIANPKGITADDLHEQMPVTNPFLKELMETFLRVGGRRGKNGEEDLDFDELGISEVVDLLDDANMEAVVRDFGDRNPQEDPVIHFYELFLKEYDAKKRMQRGVFYTPRPVVSYIVRSVDELLRTEFGLEAGLADTTTWGEMASRHADITIPVGVDPAQAFVQILDPATGTGTFLVEVIDLIHKTLLAKWKDAGHNEAKIDSLWNDYVPQHLLPRLHGYELLMAPYAIAHLKIGLKLFETGYRFGSDERARVFLTNALEPASDGGQQMLSILLPALAHEAQAVNTIKRKQRFTVVLGNPPYSQYSMNMDEAAKLHIEQFRYANGMRIRVRNALQLERNLNDDYVKFFGFAANVLPLTCGVLGMITNRMFMDAESLVGVREWFATNFESCRFVDLWGSGQESRRIQRLANDENVFDILQGVAISFLVRRRAPSAPSSVRSLEVIGSRAAKYRLLGSLAVGSGDWQSVEARAPDWWLTARTEAPSFGPEALALPEIFTKYSTLVSSNRDHLVVGFDKQGVLENVEALRAFSGSDQELSQEFNITLKAGWNVTAAREQLRGIANLEPYVTLIEYRPFDQRWIFFHSTLVWQTAPVCSSNVLGWAGNKVLVSLGKNRDGTVNGQWVSETIADKSVVSSRDNASGFPLYLNAQQAQISLDGDSQRAPNLSPEFLKRLAAKLGVRQKGAHGLPQGVSADDIFHYIYAILNCPGYRDFLEVSLSAGFPIIPLPPNRKLFDVLANLGHDLVSVHLLRANAVAPGGDIACKTGSPELQVEHVAYSKGTVWLDAAKTRGFDCVPEAVWDFHVGGYQVCHKWLKDRKGRTLSDEDIAHYQKIIVALSETIRIMKEIDEVIEEHGGWPGAFQAAEQSANAKPAVGLKMPPFERIEPTDDEKFETCVPLVTLKAAAGGFGDSQEVDAEGWVRLNTEHKLSPGMFVAQVVGKSMDPLIRDGAYCLFSAPVTGTRQGKVVLVEHHSIEDPETGGRYTVKRYFSEKTTDESGGWRHTAIRLMPENPDFEPIIVAPNVSDELRVIAELVEVLGAKQIEER